MNESVVLCGDPGKPLPAPAGSYASTPVGPR